MKNNKTTDKPIYKQWWFWIAIVAVLAIIGFATQGADNTDTANNGDTNNSGSQKTLYTLEGEKLGEYGKEITLNASSDMPVKKYLYKLPAGKYKVTTTWEKMASFYIVKDEIGTEDGNTQYPETLQYVGEAYLLTAGDDDFSGKAKKEVEITLGEDESISLVGTETFVFEKL